MKKNSSSAAWILALIVGIGVIVFFFKPTPKPVEAPYHEKFDEALKELKIEDLTPGTGSTAENGRKLSIHYTGTLQNGKKFDSSYDRNQPLEFTLGSAQVIPGMERGILGMREGGKRKITIPPFLGYGDKPVGELIPANSTLIFEVTLVKVNVAAPVPVQAEPQTTSSSKVKNADSHSRKGHKAKPRPRQRD